MPSTNKFSLVDSHKQNSTLSSAQEILVIAPANAMIAQSLSQNIRFTLDGSNPTATKGFQLRAGDPAARLPVQTNSKLRFIEETASAVLQYQFIVEYGLPGEV